MATKSKVTQRSDPQAHGTAAGKRGGQGSESLVIDESGMDQIVEEVSGTMESTDPVFGTELTEAEKHRPLCSPVQPTSRRRETTESAAETDPIVDASFANISSLHDEREFWGAVTRAIGPLILSTVKKTGTSLVKGGIKKLSPTLANMLRLEGFSESVIQQLESGQQESGADVSAPDQREFWGAIAGALVPVLMPHAKKLAGSAVKTGGSWVRRIFESSQQESGAEMEGLSQQLENLFIQQASSQQESGSISSADQREFWRTIARKLAPVLSPVAKAVAGAAVSAGKSIVTGGIKRLSPTIANMLRLEGFSESAIQQLESGQQESGDSSSVADQREFWGAIAGALVPVLMPHAKKLAGAAVKTGGSWVKRIFESSQQESGAEMEGLSLQLESLFIQQASSQQESGSISSADQREFWGAIARKLIPVLSPIAKTVAGTAVSVGKSMVTGGIKRLSPTIANMLRLEGFSESAIQQLESGQQESGADVSAPDQREFWGAIAGALVPALMPHAKKLAGAAFKTGGSWVKRIFESSQQESGAEMEGLSLQLESLFIQQASSQQESGSISSADQREFWGAIARKIVPVLSPIAKAAASSAGNAGMSWIKKIFESSEQEFEDETVALSQQYLSQQLEGLFIQEAASTQQESGGSVSVEDQREFWGAIARKLIPVLSPIAKTVAGAAVNAGKSVVTGGIKKLSPTIANMLRLQGFSESAIQQLESGQQESGDGSSDADQREFWGAIARTLVPVLKPFVKKIGRAAVSASGSLVTSGLKKFLESSQLESGEDAMAVREAFVQQLEALEVIIGNDDRVQVTSTTHVPFNRICHLSIMAADGSPFLGTGFFIGPRTIITAGHCVYDRDHGGWPQQIVVSPGRNGFDKPFGQFIATKFCSVEGWTENQDRDCDYGVIQLSKNDNVSPQIGSFGFGIFSDEALANKQLNVAGYPGDQPSGTMMFHSRKAIALNPTTIVYDIDTVGGQSGSAVYDENRCVVAIHTNGASSGNSATRITQSVFNNLNTWRMEGGTS